MPKPSNKADSDEAAFASAEKIAAGAFVYPQMALPAQLKEAVKMIIRLVQPQKIFWIGTYANKLEDKIHHELLIVLPQQMLRPHREYQTLVDHIGLTICALSATLLKNTDYYKMLSAGHIYFTRFCRMERLLYTANDSPVPKPACIPVGQLIQQAEARFNNRFSHSRAFLEGAEFYIAKKHRALAAFMLQQTVELTYRAITLGLTGHELLSNQLRSHLIKAYRCSPEIDAAFSPENEADMQLLELLETAYIQGRYKDHFRVNPAELNLLLDKTARLHQIAEAAFKYHLHAITKVLQQL